MTPPARAMQQPGVTSARRGAARAAAAVCGLLLLAACARTTISPDSPATTAGPTAALTPQPAATTAPSAANTAPAPSPSPTPKPPDSTSGPVEIALSKDEYAVGEGVEYTFTNHSGKPIYFQYGSCDFPFIYQRAGGEAAMLVTNILDYEPNITELAAGDSLACVWDQTVWAISSDPVDYDPEPQDLQDHRYYIELYYAFTEEGADVVDAQRRARSGDFWIR